MYFHHRFRGVYVEMCETDSLRGGRTQGRVDVEGGEVATFAPHRDTVEATVVSPHRVAGAAHVG
jgi:hypothetical protein